MLVWEQDVVCRSNKIKQSSDIGFVICGTTVSGYCNHTAKNYTPNIISSMSVSTAILCGGLQTYKNNPRVNTMHQLLFKL
jgi:putative N-acetylmannosamine-6-phosphate epimerase